MIFLLKLLVYFPDVGDKLESRLSLGFNYFLNNLFSDIKFLLFLLCLEFRQGVEGFSQKSNKISFIWRPASIKF